MKNNIAWLTATYADVMTDGKGSFKPYDPATDFLCTIGGNIVDGFLEEIKSPLKFQQYCIVLYRADQQESVYNGFA